MNFDLLQYLFSIGFLYIYGRLFLHYGLIFINFMLDQGVAWKARSEKPRILFILTGLVFMHLMAHAKETEAAENYLLRAIIILAFALGLFLGHIPWTNRFQSNLLTPKNPAPKQEDRNFNLRISDLQLQKLYNELVRYDLVQSVKTSLQDFKNVLTKNWDIHNSRIHFNMDGPSCREFYDHLVQAFPHNSLSLKNFFESSKLVLRTDGKRYNYHTIKNAPTRSNFSKKHEELKEIFQKINNLISDQRSL